MPKWVKVGKNMENGKPFVARAFTIFKEFRKLGGHYS